MFSHFCNPPLSPPPLSTPAGVERGAWILLLVSGQASIDRSAATMVGEPRLLACCRSQWLGFGVPTTAVAERPAVHETGFATGWRSRQPWRADRCEFSTTVGLPIGARRGSGGIPRRRSVAEGKPPNPGPPLYPGGGREGRGGVWGVTNATKHKPPQAGCKARTTDRRTPAKSRSYQEGF